MKTTIRQYIMQSLLPVCLTALLAGCGQEETPCGKDTADGKIPLQILLKQPESLTVEANGPRGITIEGITLSNVWVVQFSTSSACLANKYYTNLNKGTDYTATVTTGNDFSNVESRFYVIVNAENSLLTADDLSLTEDKLKAKAVATNTSGPIFDASSAPLQLVAGPIKFTPKKGSEGDSEVKAALVAPLERPYAQLEFKYANPTKGSFTPVSLKIKNLPQNLYVCKGEGKYPATSTISSTEQTIWASSSGTWTATAAKSCYVGENLRGSGTATAAGEKGVPDKGPGGNLTGCTMITLTGTYRYDAAHTDGVTVTYTLYLGGNLINDYNIQRNTKYAVTVNVGGANSADIRVSVTNGNVAYFEEVKEVKPDYEVTL